MSIGLVIAGLGIYFASRLLTVHDPPGPAGVEPQIFLTVLSPPPGRVLGLNRFDVELHVDVSGCHNPVRVALRLGLRGSNCQMLWMRR